jgi:hypothetical protein
LRREADRHAVHRAGSAGTSRHKLEGHPRVS